MKLCLFTILDDNFMIGFKTFMKSFLANNEWFNADFLILDTGLSDVNKEICRGIYSNIIFKQPKYDQYKNVDMSQTHDKLKKTYYFLDAFAQYEYDKVVSVDVDMIVLKSMQEIIMQSTNRISGCKLYNKTKDILLEGINAGLFIIGKDYLNQNVYTNLLGIARKGFSMPEQKTMNIAFKGQYTYIDKRFNVEKRMYHSLRYKDIVRDAAVWHYVGLKPWEDHTRAPKHELEYNELEKLWWEWNRK